MEEVLLPRIVLDKPEPFVNSQRTNLACHFSPPGPVVTRDGASGHTPGGGRRIAASFHHRLIWRHATPQPRSYRSRPHQLIRFALIDRPWPAPPSTSACGRFSSTSTRTCENEHRRSAQNLWVA